VADVAEVQMLAVGEAVSDVHWQTKEGEHVGVYETARNHSKRIAEMLEFAGIFTPAAWCMAAVYLWCREACDLTGHPFTMREIELKALVQSGVDWAEQTGRIVPAEDRIPGDWAAFSFGGSRYDHVGLVQSVDPFQTVEGNTHVPDGDDDLPTFQPGQREGYEVEVVTTRKLRHAKPTLFVRWAEL